MDNNTEEAGEPDFSDVESACEFYQRRLLVDPLICDECGCCIERTEDGAIEWLSVAGVNSGFRLVHGVTASPKAASTGREGCYRYGHPTYRGNRNDLGLARFAEKYGWGEE